MNLSEIPSDEYRFPVSNSVLDGHNSATSLSLGNSVSDGSDFFSTEVHQSEYQSVWGINHVDSYQNTTPLFPTPQAQGDEKSFLNMDEGTVMFCSQKPPGNKICT